MDPYVVRAARPADVAALPGIEDAAAARFAGLPMQDAVLADSTSLADFRHAQQQGLLWVATTGAGVVVGFALVEICDGNAHLDEIDVLPAHGRRGVGAALVAAVRAAARARGCAAVTLTTYRDVAWNAPFYARQGFRVLPADEWTPGLHALVEREDARGLRRQDRVVMRCAVN